MVSDDACDVITSFDTTDITSLLSVYNTPT